MQAVQSEPPSVGGTLTGWGGDIIILDDPHKPEDAASEKKRNSVLDWFKSTLLSRLNDPGAGPIILIQQRVHEGDLAGYLLEQGGWEHLDLTSTAEEPNTIELGSYVFAAQYQQRPAPLGGGIVKWDWFHTYDVAPARIAGDRIIQS